MRSVSPVWDALLLRPTIDRFPPVRMGPRRETYPAFSLRPEHEPETDPDPCYFRASLWLPDVRKKITFVLGGN